MSGYKKRPLGGAGDHRHGTVKGYSYYGCRCERCREAHREDHRLWRDGQVKSHGPGGYEKGCRCDVCAKAKRVLNAEYIQRSKRRAAVEKLDMSKLA